MGTVKLESGFFLLEESPLKFFILTNCCESKINSFGHPLPEYFRCGKYSNAWDRTDLFNTVSSSFDFSMCFDGEGTLVPKLLNHFEEWLRRWNGGNPVNVEVV